MRSTAAVIPASAPIQRLPLLDALRGLAALSVCWYHFTNSYAISSTVRESGAYGWLGVEVFFVLSGFVIPYVLYHAEYNARRDWSRFLLKRIIRIEPPYLVAALGGILLWYLSSLAPGFQGQFSSDLFSLSLLLHVGYLTGIAGYEWLNPVFWTLAIEFQFYLLISIVFPVLTTRVMALRWAVALCFAALTFALKGSSHNFIFGYLGLFSIGIAVFQFRAGIVDLRECLALCAVAAASVAVGHNLPTAMVALITGLVIIWKAEAGTGKYLSWLGTISYSLYLVHVPVGGRVVNLGKRFITTTAGEFALSVFAVGVSLLAAYIMYLLVEQPAQRAARRIRLRGGSFAAAPKAMGST